MFGMHQRRNAQIPDNNCCPFFSYKVVFFIRSLMTEFRGGGGGWSGFGAYMRDKTIKLSEQFGGRYDKVSDLLKNKTFWSTGRMAGVDSDIKELITNHGGEYLQYGFRNVTHILASNLAMSNQNWKKLLGGKFASKSYAVVTPQWLMDSIAAGRCLPESDYLPDCLKASNDLRDILMKPVTDLSETNDVNFVEFHRLSLNRTPSSNRIVRCDINNPISTHEVVDNICCDLIEEGAVYSREFVALTIVKHNFVHVEGLVFRNSCTSLSEVLFDKLAAESWEGVSRMSVILRPLAEGSTAARLDILPSITGLPPTELNNQLNSLKTLMLESDEDTIMDTVTRCLVEAGPAISLVILDVFDTLLASRKLDLARDMVLCLRNRVKSYPNEELIDWFECILTKCQQLFQLRNQGAILHL